jgi:hypothetical protein
MYAEAEKDDKQMHLYLQAVQLNAYLECSKHDLLELKYFLLQILEKHT